MLNNIIALFEKFQMSTIEALEYYSEKFNINKVQKNECINIAIFYHVLGKGGVQKVISLLTPMLIEKGYNVVLITEEEAQETDYFISKEVKRYVIEKVHGTNKNEAFALRARQLEKIFTDEKIDVLCHQDSLSSLLLYDFLIANSCNIHFVLHKHQIFSRELSLCKNYYFEQKRLYKLFSKVIVLTTDEKKYWNMLGVNAEYIPNPFEGKLGNVIRKNKEYIVWVGRLDITSKRFLAIIPIMKKVIKRYPDCKLKMFGSGESSLVNYLQKEIMVNDLQNNIEYCGYTLDLDEIYSGAKVQLSVSVYETFPMNIYEGKSYGIPLVTYDLPYIELLKDGKGYISVPQGDIEQAADAIVQILSDSQLEQRLGDEALAGSMQFRSIDIAEKWERVLKSLNSESKVDNLSEDAEKVFDIIYRHCDCLREEYKEKNNESKQLREQLLLLTIKNRILENNMNVAIYPYGKMGKKIKNWLNRNGIYEKYIIDNHLASEDSGIVTLKELKDINLSKVLFVICSSTRSGYYEIREPLWQLVNKENIVDVFTEESMFGRRIVL